jgi:hypothetical protein
MFPARWQLRSAATKATGRSNMTCCWVCGISTTGQGKCRGGKGPPMGHHSLASMRSKRIIESASHRVDCIARATPRTGREEFHQNSLAQRRILLFVIIIIHGNLTVLLKAFAFGLTLKMKE